MWDVTDTTRLRGLSPRALLPESLRGARPWQSWQAVLAAGLAVLTTAAVTVVVRGHDPASAQTYITAVTRAEVELPDGRSMEAKIGALLPRGATLRTGTGGGARLTTDGRDVYLGGLSTVVVVDGVRQVLDRGLVMVDTRNGPALTLRTSAGAGTVSTPQGALARVEQNVATLRLAVYDGSASLTAAGRRVTTAVAALHQLRVPYGGVPEPVTALALTVRNGVYDPWEQRLASNLVSADIDLNSFATGLNGVDGLAVLNAAPTSLRTLTSQGALQGGTRGEQALTVAVAQKAKLHRDVLDNLAEVDRDRGEGGSWGVVAAIVMAPVTDVTNVLGTSLGPDTPNPILAAGPIPTAVLSTDLLHPQPTPAPTDTTHRPTRSPTPTPTVSPTRSPVDQAVATVVQLLPTPTPTPTPTPVGNLLRDLLKVPGSLVPALH